MNYVYILTNAAHTVLYIGVTSNLPRRLYEHKHELIDGFTQTYHVHELMYAEPYSDIRTAIAREKQLKKWGRQKKITSSQRIIPIGLTCPQTGFHNFGASDISGKTYPFPTLSFRAQREIFFVPFFYDSFAKPFTRSTAPTFSRYGVSRFSLSDTRPLTANEKDPSASLGMTIREERVSHTFFV